MLGLLLHAPDSAVLCVIAPFRVVPGLTPTLSSIQKETPFPLTIQPEPRFPTDYNASGQVPTAKPIAAARGYARPSLAYASVAKEWGYTQHPESPEVKAHHMGSHFLIFMSPKPSTTCDTRGHAQ